MELFQYSGFQTIEFALTVILAIRLLITRSCSASFLIGLATLAVASLTLLHLRSELVPILPFFVSAWRILATLFGATLVGEFVEEWRKSPGGLGTAHTLGVATSLAGVGLIWLNNDPVSATCLLMADFVVLGYCARENRLSKGP